MKTYEADEGNTLPYPLHNTLTKPMRGHAAQSGDAEYMSLWYQSAAKLEVDRRENRFGRIVRIIIQKS